MSHGNWNDIIQKYNNQWFNNDKIMKDGFSHYGFGMGLSMIQDIFCPNIIHIAGGYQSQNKYGYFEFDKECLNNNNMS